MKLERMKEEDNWLKMSKPRNHPKVVIDEYPEAFRKNWMPEDQRMLHYMYRCFVTACKGAMKDDRTVPFLVETYKELKKKFSLKEKQMPKYLMSIINRLSLGTAKDAKLKMLRGIITPRQLVQNKEETYLNHQMM